MTLNFNVFEELAKFNQVKFSELNHKQLIDGKAANLSVTKLLNLFKKEFNEEFWAYKKAKELGISKEEVKKEWRDKRNSSSSQGTEYHSSIEGYLKNKLAISSEQFKINYPGFYQFWEVNKAKEQLIPVASELSIGDKDLLIGGTLDQLFQNVLTDSLEIWDWKTNESFTTSSKQKFKSPISHLDTSHLSTYSLQLSIYQQIIEKYTNLRIGKKMILHLDRDGGQTPIECLDLHDEVLTILEVQKSEFKSNILI